MIIRSPGIIDRNKKHSFSVFLAGSIEMGKAENWQEQIEDAFKDHNDIVLFNPRRVDWDSSWIQDIRNPQFKEQVDWELNAMEAADCIVMYFAPGTKSPVTLLELGLHASSGKLIVCCPEGFWRKGNVDIVCRRSHIPQVHSIEALISGIYQKEKENNNK